MYKAFAAALCAALLAPWFASAVNADKFVDGEFSREWSIDGFSTPIETDDSGYVDLRNFVDGKPSSEKYLTCRGTFTAPRDGLMLLGAGADWWFDIRINDVPAFSTTDVGNADFPISIHNQVAVVPVRAGVNKITAVIRSGSNGCSMAIDALPFTPENYAKIDRRQRMSQIFPPSAIVLRQPIAIRPKADACSFSFGTDGDIPSGVQWRKRGDETWNTVWELFLGQVAANRTDHIVTVDGLEPNTEYELRIVMVDPNNWTEVYSPEISVFRTLPAAGTEFRFFATGDTQFPAYELRPKLEGFVKNYDLENCNFIIHLGDLDHQFSYRELNDALLPLTRFGARVIPVVQVRGNHEYRGIERSDFAQFFSPDGKTYYSFQAGDAFFIVLDSGEDHDTRGTGSNYAYNFSAKMLAEEKAWLAEVIESPEFKNAKFRIVVSHGATEDGYYQLIAATMRNMTDEFFAGKNPKAQIHLWLSGHIHRYLRTIPGTAKFLSPDDPGANRMSTVYRPYTIVAVGGPEDPIAPLSGFNVIVSSDELKVDAVTPEGNLLDSFIVRPDGSVESQPNDQLREFGSDITK